MEEIVRGSMFSAKQDKFGWEGSYLVMNSTPERSVVVDLFIGIEPEEFLNRLNSIGCKTPGFIGSFRSETLENTCSFVPYFRELSNDILYKSNHCIGVLSEGDMRRLQASLSRVLGYRRPQVPNEYTAKWTEQKKQEFLEDCGRMSKEEVATKWGFGHPNAVYLVAAKFKGELE